MYTPAAFRQDSTEEILSFIEANGFGAVVSAGEEGFQATHLPFTLLRPSPASGREAPLLVGHMAKGNVHAKILDGRDVLVILQGPHAYISPTWYATHPSVPTWDYVVVHAHGRARILEGSDPRQVEAMETMIEHYEGTGPEAWSMKGLSDSLRTRLLQGIVGIEVEVTRFEASFKLSQNRSAADRKGAIENLLRQGGMSAEVAALIQKYEPAEVG